MLEDESVYPDGIFSGTEEESEEKEEEEERAAKKKRCTYCSCILEYFSCVKMSMF